MKLLTQKEIKRSLAKRGFVITRTEKVSGNATIGRGSLHNQIASTI